MTGFSEEKDNNGIETNKTIPPQPVDYMKRSACLWTGCPVVTCSVHIDEATPT